MSTDVSESSRAENSGGQQLWNSIAGLLCCCTSSTTRVSGNDIETKERKSNGEKNEKKKSKGNSSGSSDGDTNLLQSEETLFGKQWFGYSRNLPKKGKSLKKNTNLDDLGTESKPIDTNIMKAKLDVRQRQKRAPSAQHIKRMISNDVFDNNIPQEPTKEADEQSRSEGSKTIPEENPVEAKTEENAENVDSSKPPEQNADTSLASKENGETKDAEETPADVVAKQENPAAAKEELQEVATSTSGETAKENTAVETSDAKKSNETKDVTKDVTEAVASNDVTMTSDDAVKDAAVSPADVKASNDLELQPLVKDTEDISSSADVIPYNAPAVAKDEITDSPLPPTIESPTESSSPEKNRDGEQVLSNRENCSAPPSDLLLQPNEKNATHREEEEEKKKEDEVPKAEASKNKEQASTEETKDERTENKNDDGSRKPEAEPSEIKDEHEKQEKTEAEKEISSSESHLPTEAMIKAQET